MNLIETIRIVLYYLIYIGITSFILLLISSSIQDFRELRAWAKEEKEEGEEGEDPPGRINP